VATINSELTLCFHRVLFWDSLFELMSDFNYEIVHSIVAKYILLSNCKSFPHLFQYDTINEFFKIPWNQIFIALFLLFGLSPITLARHPYAWVLFCHNSAAISPSRRWGAIKIENFTRPSGNQLNLLLIYLVQVNTLDVFESLENKTHKFLILVNFFQVLICSSWVQAFSLLKRRISFSWEWVRCLFIQIVEHVVLIVV